MSKHCEHDQLLCSKCETEIANLRAEVERLQAINRDLLRQKDGIDKDVFGSVCDERDEALKEVERLKAKALALAVLELQELRRVHHR